MDIHSYRHRLRRAFLKKNNAEPKSKFSDSSSWFTFNSSKSNITEKLRVLIYQFIKF